MKLNQFLDHLRLRNYSDATIASYRIELQKFQAYLREQRLRVNQVKPRDVLAYLRQRDTSFDTRPSSTRRRLATLRTFYDYVGLMSDGRVRNPIEPIRYPRRQPPNPRPLTGEHLTVLIGGIDNDRDRAIVSLLSASGLRLSELCSLNRDSIRVEHLGRGLERKVVGLGRVVGKGGKTREFLVPLATLGLIHRYLSTRGQDGIDALFVSNRRRRLDKRTVQHLLRGHCRRLGLPLFHPHQLRATFASRLDAAGMPLRDVSTLLGHASLDTTLAYVKADARRIRTEYFAAQERLSSQ